MSKNLMYSEDFQWYDPAIYNAIMALDNKYPNAIPVFGGALGAYNHINSEHPDFNKFIRCLPEVVHSAKFYSWHEGIVGAVRRFCHLCLVDPNLVEVYIGVSLDEFCTALQ